MSLLSASRWYLTTAICQYISWVNWNVTNTIYIIIWRYESLKAVFLTLLQNVLQELTVSSTLISVAKFVLVADAK